jgi:hypothetical protein
VPPPTAIVRILPDGGESVMSTPGEVCILDDVSKDGQWMLCHSYGGGELVAKPLVAGQQPVIVRKSRAGIIDQARFSPDRRWIAYNANESGRYEVYVIAFLSSGERWQISREGGVQPVWRHDGHALYYLSLDGFLKTVTLQSVVPPRFSGPTTLLDTGLSAPSPWIEQYLASVDGERFLVLKPADTKVRNSVGVILNWPALLHGGHVDR